MDRLWCKARESRRGPWCLHHGGGERLPSQAARWFIKIRGFEVEGAPRRSEDRTRNGLISYRGGP